MATPAEADAVVEIVRLFGVVVLRPDVVRFTEEAPGLDLILGLEVHNMRQVIGKYLGLLEGRVDLPAL